MKHQERLIKLRDKTVKKLVPPPAPEKRKPATALLYAVITTGVFFVVALIGIWHHEMWRDEHQAWLVARDAHSLPQLFENMRYEGNPALWHLFLYVITCFTSNPIGMQALHLLIACGFIFVFNRYAEIVTPLKIMFSFGYFTLYEYCVISRSYGLGVLLVFIICALYKNRHSNYILIGIALALLANVTIYGAVISLGLAGTLLLDYFLDKKKERSLGRKIFSSLAIHSVGTLLSLYQIWPDKGSAFAAQLATDWLYFPRWALAASRLFISYLYVPNLLGMHFWNTNIYFDDNVSFQAPFGAWLVANPQYLWGMIFMPALVFCLGVLTFIRKPLILLLYTGVTAALLALYYHTMLFFSRYCGHLLIVLVACFWLAEYYPEKQYKHFILRLLSRAGKKVSTPFLALILIANVVGAVVAYAKDYQFRFSTSKDAADYITRNKLDTLTITGGTDFVLSPLASYLNTRVFYQEMNAYGSFCVWSKQRNNDPTMRDVVNSIILLMEQGKDKALLVWNAPPRMARDGKTVTILERGRINKDIKLDLIKSFEAGIVDDETYYLYLVQKTDPTKEDLSQYPALN